MVLIDSSSGKTMRVVEYNQFEVPPGSELEVTFVRVLEEKKKVLLGCHDGRILLFSQEFQFLY